jgi:aryl-alcohol dehydrogenase-like predicted oxidoreductase
MKYRKLGNTGLNTSTRSIGTACFLKSWLTSRKPFII